MIPGEQTVVCVKGNMVLSEWLYHSLNSVFITGSSTMEQKRLGFIVGGNWYCPADGSLMIEEDGFVICPVCKKVLNGFFFDLVERHPHS